LELIFRIFLLLSILLPSAAWGQFYVAGLGGAASLSNGASAGGTPAAASNYAATAGAAFQAAAGYHFSDWVSVQGFYIWNRNRVVTTLVQGNALSQSSEIVPQRALGVDGMMYFRARSSRIRPYLSGGPAWVRILGENKLGFRTAVGMDVRIRSGWSARYSFSEMMTANPLAQRLTPSAGGLLMNFENVVGFTKTF
jgi:hypothetical protein